MYNPYNNSMVEEEEEGEPYPNIREEYRELLTNYLQNQQYLITCLNNYLIMTMEDQKMLLTDLISFNSEFEGLLRDINTDDVNGEGINVKRKPAIPRDFNYTTGRDNNNRDDDLGDEYY